MDYDNIKLNVINERLQKNLDAYTDKSLDNDMYGYSLNGLSKGELAILKAALVNKERDDVTIAEDELARDIARESKQLKSEPDVILLATSEAAMVSFIAEATNYVDLLKEDMQRNNIARIELDDAERNIITLDEIKGFTDSFLSEVGNPNLYSANVGEAAKNKGVEVSQSDISFIQFEISHDEMNIRANDHRYDIHQFYSNETHKPIDAFHREAIIGVLSNSEFAKKYITEEYNKETGQQERKLGYSISHDMTNGRLRVATDTRYSVDIQNDITEMLKSLDRLPASEKYKNFDAKTREDIEFKELLDSGKTLKEKDNIINNHLKNLYQSDNEKGLNDAYLNYIHNQLTLRLLQMQNEKVETKKAEDRELSITARRMMMSDPGEIQYTDMKNDLVRTVEDAISPVTEKVSVEKDFGYDVDKEWGF